MLELYLSVFLGNLNADSGSSNSMRFPKNLLRLMSFGIALSVGISAYWSYRIVRQLLLDSLRDNALAEVQSSADKIDQWLVARKAEIRVLSSTPVVQTLDWSMIDLYLQYLVTDQTNFFKFAVAYPDGTRYNTSGATRLDGNIKDRPNFRFAMEGHTFVSDPIISRSTKVHQVNIANPVRSRQSAIEANNDASESILGVFIGSVSVNRITELINQLEYGKGSYSFALNSKGHAISHPNADLMSTYEEPGQSFLDSPNLALAEIAQRMVNGDQGIELLQLDGHSQYIVFLPLQEADWSIALAIPRHNIEQQLLPLDILAFLTAFLIAGMMFVLWQLQTLERRTFEKNRAALESQILEKNCALKQLKNAQAQLIHTEKMSGLGQLAAGMAHEINNPLSFIEGNIEHASKYAEDLLALVALYQRGKTSIPSNRQKWQAEIELYIQTIDLDFVRADFPNLMRSMQHGVSRIKEINSSLQLFARVDEKGIKKLDIKAALENTLSILSARLNNSITIVREYNEIPEIQCRINQINQVFLNILTNAIDALNEKQKLISAPSSDDDFVITLQTESDHRSWVRVYITDTGCGIAPDFRDLIFDPFFTTKRIGKGVGLGLSTCHQIVVEQHGGTLAYRPASHGGSTFTIQLPIYQT